MAISSIITQILAEASRLWNELHMQMTPGQNGFVDKCEDSFTDFASQFADLLSDMNGYTSSSTGKIGQLLDPYLLPMYLHIHAAIPRKSDGTIQAAIPNQNNSNTNTNFIMGRGRIHCLGLAGSYVPEGITMTIRQFDRNEALTREDPAWNVPVCNRNIVPSLGAYGGHFNSAMGWICYTNPMQQPPSHCSGLYPYFEKIGFTPKTYYTRFDVTCTPVGKWWSAACVWESEYSHGSIKWRDQQ